MARRVAVTGGAGKLGRAVVADLGDHGYDVVILDRAVPPGKAEEDVVRLDLTDYGQVLGALTATDDRYDGVDAVVHLAAIRAQGLAPNAATFHHNVLSTYNVFEACRATGITNVVWASSETVLGLPSDEPPPYAPVDEEDDGTGLELFVIANADTVMSTPSGELMAQVFPDVELRGEISGTDTLLGIDKARRVLGYEPRHTWRHHV